MFTSAAAVAAVAYIVGSSHGADAARVSFETATSSPAAVEVPPSDEDFPTITEDDLAPTEPTPPVDEPAEVPADVPVEVPVESAPVVVEAPVEPAHAPLVDGAEVAELVAVADAVADLDAEVAALRAVVPDVVADVVPDVGSDVAVPDAVEETVADVTAPADRATEPVETLLAPPAVESPAIEFPVVESPVVESFGTRVSESGSPEGEPYSPAPPDFEHFHAGEHEIAPVVEPSAEAGHEATRTFGATGPEITWSGDHGALVSGVGADEVEIAPAFSGGW
ncbi:hypothetical protein AB0H12_12385 [Actinosynnema sp. NPDC023794]